MKNQIHYDKPICHVFKEGRASVTLSKGEVIIREDICQAQKEVVIYPTGGSTKTSSKLRESMKEAGFKFPKDRSTMTSTEMAKALGISVSYLYYLERRGKVPSPPRDHAGKRMWAKKDVRKLRRRLSR